jgi:hypothetical protein
VRVHTLRDCSRGAHCESRRCQDFDLEVGGGGVAIAIDDLVGNIFGGWAACSIAPGAVLEVEGQLAAGRTGGNAGELRDAGQVGTAGLGDDRTGTRNAIPGLGGAANRDGLDVAAIGAEDVVIAATHNAVLP